MSDDQFPVDDEVDSVLAAQLAELGARTTVFGAGRLGAGWTAKRLKTETSQTLLDVSGRDTESLTTEIGQVLGAAASRAQQEDSQTVWRGIVGSGFASMNPAYVIIVLDRQAATLGIAAHAKEGLIRQRTAQKAVSRVRETLGL